MKFNRNVIAEYITIQRDEEGVLEINGIDVHQGGKFKINSTLFITSLSKYSLRD